MKHLLLAVVLLFSAQAARSASVGAVVQRWRYNPATQTVTVQILNTSEKDITGYNISIKETYADGTTNSHEMLSDFVDTMLLMQEVKGTDREEELRRQLGDGVLHPGMIREESFAVLAQLTNYEALVDVVAYADGTSEATNQAGLERMVDHRKTELAAMQKANEVVNAALADSNDASPRRTAEDQLKKLLAARDTQMHSKIEFDPGTLKGVLVDLEAPAHQSINERDYLVQYVARKETQISSLSRHTQLVKIGEQR